ncbi:hypothetical protein Ccrd_017089 [Cynara cardunculus var. scolymus]|uniref:DUF4149 domain-containing protein n=1 Tax=Cynara cardunculus var. scolymus TaxID=59895 RepID=A0A118K2L8_CYNCS|nr:hypothetical protein Ccrd_017089 [Cynara cardunculus var. scolymus]
MMEVEEKRYLEEGISIGEEAMMMGVFVGEETMRYICWRRDDERQFLTPKMTIHSNHQRGRASIVFFNRASIVFFNLPVSVGCFGYTHPWKSSSSADKYQLGFLLFAFAFNLTNILIFIPMTIEMMKQRHKVERESNIGDKSEKVNLKLATINKKVGMVHGLSSLVVFW